MPLNAATTGDAIAALIVSQRPDPGVAITDAALRTLWEGIIGIIYADLASNAQVAPGTFTNGFGAITGEGGPIT